MSALHFQIVNVLDMNFLKVTVCKSIYNCIFSLDYKYFNWFFLNTVELCFARILLLVLNFPSGFLLSPLMRNTALKIKSTLTNTLFVLFIQRRLKPACLKTNREYNPFKPVYFNILRAVTRRKGNNVFEYMPYLSCFYSMYDQF